jgi:hypothetical protein
MRVYLNRRDRRFPDFVDQRFDSGVKALALADVNEDGAPDAVFTRADEPELRVYWGTRPGDLRARGFFPLAESPRDLVKLEGRGAGTLIAASASMLHSLKPDVEDWLLASRVLEFPGSSFEVAAAADFDGDGTGELALGDGTRDGVLVIFLDEAGAVRREAFLDLGFTAARLSTGDLDLDGILDLAVANPSMPRITIIPGPVADRGPPFIQAPLPGGAASLAVADLDADGKPDMAASLESGLHILRGRGDAVFDASSVPFPLATSLLAADFDGEGAMDIAGGAATEAIILLGATSTPNPRRVEMTLPWNPYRAIDAADMDGNGSLDLIAGGDTDLWVLRSWGRGEFSEPESHPGAGIGPRAIVAEDLDGDGAPEAAVAADASRAVVVVPGFPRAAFRRGDTTSDGVVDMTDPIVLLRMLLLGGPWIPCPDAGDANDAGDLNIADAILVLNHLFLGGPPPAPPGVLECGFDATEDNLFFCRAACP